MTGDLIDFVKKRQEKIEKKRRSFERVLFRNILGISTVIDNEEQDLPIEMLDISRDGCLFQIPWGPLYSKGGKKLKKGTNVLLKMYFTKDSFIPINIKIKYAREDMENEKAFLRCGCEFDKSTTSFTALNSFINFLYSFAEHSATDREDLQIDSL